MRILLLIIGLLLAFGFTAAHAEDRKPRHIFQAGDNVYADFSYYDNDGVMWIDLERWELRSDQTPDIMWVSYFGATMPESLRAGNDDSGKTEHVRAYDKQNGTHVDAYDRHPAGTAPHGR